MIRVIIDTNVVVSAQLADEGHPASILDLAYTGKIQMFISPEVWAEYEEVLRRPKFQKFGLSPKLVADALLDIRTTSAAVHPKYKARKARDPKDNPFLAAAAAAGADYLVTGNTRHFPKSYRKTRVVTPAEFIALIAPILGLPKTRS